MPEPTAVVDAYAVLKMLSREQDHGELYILLNQCTGREEAEKFANGIAVTANKLLNTYVQKLGYIVSDPRVAQSVRQRRPFLLAYPMRRARLSSISGPVDAEGSARRLERPSFVASSARLREVTGWTGSSAPCCRGLCGRDRAEPLEGGLLRGVRSPGGVCPGPGIPGWKVGFRFAGAFHRQGSGGAASATGTGGFEARWDGAR